VAPVPDGRSNAAPRASLRTTRSSAPTPVVCSSPAGTRADVLPCRYRPATGARPRRATRDGRGAHHEDEENAARAMSDQLEQLVERRPFAQRDVVDLVDRCRVIDHRGEQIRLDSVVDIAEIARRSPSPLIKTGSLRIMPATHFGITAAYTPSRSWRGREYVEIAQPESSRIHSSERKSPRRARSRTWSTRRATAAGRSRALSSGARTVTVGCTRSCIDKARHAGAVRGHQHVEKPVTFAVVGGDRV